MLYSMAFHCKMESVRNKALKIASDLLGDSGTVFKEIGTYWDFTVLGRFEDTIALRTLLEETFPYHLSVKSYWELNT